MTKRIKFLFASVVLALGFLFCFYVVSVNAETEPVVDEQQEVVENQEQQETEQPEEQEEVKEDVKSALAWFKSLDAESVKGWLVAIASYLSANALVLLALVIKLVLSKTKEYKQDKFYQELKAKMDAEHQKEMEDLMEELNQKLVDVQASVNNTIASLDEKKKEEAKTNIELLKKNLDEIKVDLEK